MKKKVALLILDGWGHGDKSKSDGIYNADTPFMDKLESEKPAAELLTHGEYVGLPEGQMGNSEVGHLNIGAGRIVYQELTRINKAIKDGEFQSNTVLTSALNKAKTENRKLHIMGLVSTGGVHSSLDHLFALVDLVEEFGIEQSYVHAFTDGRDCNPTTGLGHLTALEKHLTNKKTKVATVVGRYYAMDRDKRWDRIKLAYDLLVNGIGEAFDSSLDAIQASYKSNVTDEFITPKLITNNGQAIANIEDGDIVICFNFRTDRCREITMALTQQHFHEQNMHTLDLEYLTMTNYDKTFTGVNVIFENDNLANTLGEVVASNGLTQLRIAETEKYPHVSFFFSGGREKEFEGESRIMIPSPKVATYDLQPEMSAKEIKEAVIEHMKSHGPDFICLNFANTDMVGHTGVYDAIVKAASYVDGCVKEVVEEGSKLGYSFIIIADHGNSDFAINPDGSPNTAHSMNPVPVIVLDNDVTTIKDGTLRDVAPTILSILGVDAPAEMTGSSLVEFVHA